MRTLALEPGFFGRQDPDIAQQTRWVARVVHQQLLASNAARQHKKILHVPDPGAGCQAVGVPIKQHLRRQGDFQAAAQRGHREVPHLLSVGSKCGGAKKERGKATALSVCVSGNAAVGRIIGYTERRKISAAAGRGAADHGVHPEAEEQRFYGPTFRRQTLHNRRVYCIFTDDDCAGAPPCWSNLG
jgi:hypothetical protein